MPHARLLIVALGTAVLLIALSLITGCANPPVDDRSPEQIRASAADRSIRAQCVLATTPWGPQRTMTVELDRQSVYAGTVAANPDCAITITAQPAPPRVPASGATR